MKRILFVVMVLGWWPCLGLAQATYISQSGAGDQSGTTDCTHAKPVSYFNTVANWTLTPTGTQIGPSVTVHLCGTFTGALNANMLTAQGSGTSGHPIVIIADPGAVFTSPAWSYPNTGGGAINLNNFSFITLDGGTNGLIKNTADGEGLLTQQNTGAINVGNGSNITVQNWHISNLFIGLGNGTAPCQTVSPPQYESVAISFGTGNNLLAFNNTIDHSRVGIITNFGNAQSNVEYSHNLLSFVQHGLYGGGGATANINGLTVHDNEIQGGAYLWDSGVPNCYHHDPIHFFLTTAGAVSTNVLIYNNYIHGLFSNDPVTNASHMTAMIFLESLGPGALVFNNVMELDAGTNQRNSPTNGAIFAKGSGTPSVSSANAGMYNNTIVTLNGGGWPAEFLSNVGGIFKNNIAQGFSSGVYTPDSESTTTQFCNFNNSTGVVGNNWGAFDSLAGWQSHGQDLNTTFTNPNLNAATFVPQSPSPVIATGTNLTSLGITALNSDKNGSPRGSGAWTMGAFNSSGGVVVKPNPPVNVLATPN
jgi:hypothetical protein